jgi:23S rRNA pseudouridine1911/1915/1917 synthase
MPAKAKKTKVVKKSAKKATLKAAPIEVPQPTIIELVITEGLVEQRVDKALTMLLEGQTPVLSRARLQALVAEGHVSLGGKVFKDTSRKARLGEVYTIEVPPPEAATPEAQSMDLDIVYEDKDLLVVNKPVGMVVHPAPGNRDRTLVNALLAHCGKSLSGIGGVARPGIVHRLDKDTSGLMVVAKNDLAHQELTKQFADRSLSRTYHALVWGEPVPLVGDITGTIGRHPRDRVKMAVVSKGKSALTHYKVVESFGDIVSLVECKLATGRTHQIRVHLAYIKHPVIGDSVYGGGRNRPGAEAQALQKFPRQALHAMHLQFLHPRTEKPMTFSAPLPRDMADLVKALRKKHKKI